MVRLIDEARAAVAAVEEERRREEMKHTIEMEETYRKNNAEFARKTISELPDRIRAAFTEGLHSISVVIPVEYVSRVLRRGQCQIERWCVENGFSAKEGFAGGACHGSPTWHYIEVSW